MKKLILLSILTLLPWMANAQVKRTIHVATAGTLPNLISDEEKYQIEELTLTGELNGTDFRFIREMAGVSSSYKMRRGAIYSATNGILKYLDISNTNILKGGGLYVYTDVPYTCTDDECVDEWYTKDNCISVYLFYRTKLESIILPNSVTNIFPSAFSFCSNLTSVVVDTDNIIYDSRGNCNAIIESSTNKLVVGCKSTIISNSVTSIGDLAFYGCSGLTSVTIPNSVESIGNSAFSGCSDLTSITIPNSVTTIGSSAFYNCSGLKTIVSEIENPFDIGEGVFYSYNKDIYSTATLIVPKGKKSTYQATSGWKQFTNIVEADDYIEAKNADGVTIYYKWANDAKTELAVNYLGSSPSSCDEYSGVVIIPESVKLNGKNFSVTAIGNSAFFGCKGLTYVTIPNSIKRIDSSAFTGCSGLTSITIPNSVIFIGEFSFEGCNLTSITLGNSVAKIQDDILHVSRSPLKDVYCYAEKVPDAYLQFLGIDSKSDLILHVPASSVDSYKAHQSWSRYFKTVVPLKDGDPNPTGGGVGGLKGDLNNDGKVDAADHVELTKIIMTPK